MTTSLGYNPTDFARYILAKSGSISNMKLQKLMFYTESVFMAVTNKSLFHEDYEAWKHGPVLPSVYHEFKKYSMLRTNIPYTRESNDDELDLSLEYVELIDKVISVFGKQSDDELRNNSHREEPYITARRGLPEGANSNAVMEKTQLKKFYRAKLSSAKNPTLMEINDQMRRKTMLSISERYKVAWTELAK